MWYRNTRHFFGALIVASFFLQPVFAETPSTISLDLENVNLTDALRIFAKFNDLNLIVSPAVVGVVTLHLHAIAPEQAFNVLIASQGLVKTDQDTVTFVSTYDEIIKHNEAALHLKETTENAAELITQTWQIQFAKAEDIAHLLQDATASLLTKRGHVRVDARTNKVSVQDIPGNLVAIEALIRKWDVPVKQIRIETRLVSVDSDFERELGINFSVHNPIGSVTQHSLPDGAIAGAKFSLAVATLADASILDVALAAMENNGHGNLISKPSLFTANQQPASIESGEEIPYQEVSLSGGTGVAFKKAVLSLKVTPQIMPGNKILLELEVNQDRPSSRIVLGVPAITTRQITTKVLIGNGQTLVLGGIYELNKEIDEQLIPFLGKIPIVGLLFRQQNVKENKRELLIFVTPNIVS
jgi:type IV pilus assembly protein PilQ